MAQAEIKEYRPNALQKLRDWYERVAPKNPGQRLLFDISTGPLSGLSYLTSATEKNDKLGQSLELMGLIPGAGLLTKGQKVFRGSIAKHSIPNPQVSRRFDSPGGELGVHVTTDRQVAEKFADPNWNVLSEGYPYLYEMSSNVDKPLKLMDTGGSWQPDSVVENIKSAVASTKRRQAKVAEGFVPFESLSPNIQENLTKRNVVWPEALYHKDTGEMFLPRNSVDASFSDELLSKMERLANDYEDEMSQVFASKGKLKDIELIKNKYSKSLQQLIKEGGYDHISYINTVETNPITKMPSESAILFHPSDVSLSYTDPFEDSFK